MRFPVVLVFLAMIAVAPAKVCSAQLAQPVGISLHSKEKLSAATKTPVSLQQAGSDEPSTIGKWVVLGAFAGAVAGAVWAGVQIAHSSDPMMGNAVLAFCAGGGAVLGGLAGAVAYLAAHPPNQGQ